MFKSWAKQAKSEIIDLPWSWHLQGKRSTKQHQRHSFTKGFNPWTNLRNKSSWNVILKNSMMNCLDRMLLQKPETRLRLMLEKSAFKNLGLPKLIRLPAMLASWKSGCRRVSKTGRRTNLSRKTERDVNLNLNTRKLRSITNLLSGKSVKLQRKFKMAFLNMKRTWKPHTELTQKLLSTKLNVQCHRVSHKVHHHLDRPQRARDFRLHWQAKRPIWWTIPSPSRQWREPLLPLLTLQVLQWLLLQLACAPKIRRWLAMPKRRNVKDVVARWLWTKWKRLLIWRLSAVRRRSLSEWSGKLNKRKSLSMKNGALSNARM